jgi:hypothetical protein
MRLASRLSSNSASLLGMLIVLAMNANAGNCFKFAQPSGGDSSSAKLNTNGVCAEVLSNLNAQCNAPPNICHLTILRPFKSVLSKPSWNSVPPSKSGGQVESLYKSQWPWQGNRVAEQDAWAELAHSVEAALAARKLVLRHANLDLYGAGFLQHVYEMDTGECEQGAPSTSAIALLSPGSKSRLSAQADFTSPLGNGEIFLYRTMPYSFYGQRVRASGGRGEYNVVINQGRIVASKVGAKSMLTFENVCFIRSVKTWREMSR